MEKLMGQASVDMMENRFSANMNEMLIFSEHDGKPIFSEHE